MPHQALERLGSALKKVHPEFSRQYLEPIKIHLAFLLQNGIQRNLRPRFWGLCSVNQVKLSINLQN